MRDRRKIIFCLVCILITIIFNIGLYKSAQKKDLEYKKMMEKKLAIPVSELEERQFESEIDYRNGKLEYERKKDGYEYGYICINYDINTNIDKLDIKLEYNDNLYIDDIFYDAFYIFNLLDLNIENKYNLDSDLADNFAFNNEIIVNNKIYNLGIRKTEDKKIVFEIK